MTTISNSKHRYAQTNNSAAQIMCGTCFLSNGGVQHSLLLVLAFGGYTAAQMTLTEIIFQHVVDRLPFFSVYFGQTLLHVFVHGGLGQAKLFAGLTHGATSGNNIICHFNNACPYVLFHFTPLENMCCYNILSIFVNMRSVRQT